MLILLRRPSGVTGRCPLLLGGHEMLGLLAQALESIFHQGLLAGRTPDVRHDPPLHPRFVQWFNDHPLRQLPQGEMRKDRHPEPRRDQAQRGVMVIQASAELGGEPRSLTRRADDPAGGALIDVVVHPVLMFQLLHTDAVHRCKRVIGRNRDREVFDAQLVSLITLQRSSGLVKGLVANIDIRRSPTLTAVRFIETDLSCQLRLQLPSAKNHQRNPLLRNGGETCDGQMSAAVAPQIVDHSVQSVQPGKSLISVFCQPQSRGGGANAATVSFEQL
ncbi:hypothetical protein D3250_11310 [Nesterenkonia natronophila]|uniref:Uncharacterized protein n=1 Tax=Nesterenkonia natronophila TaxID=2174932 RepID=A0A3A4FZN6_9MICC|nr:hypothetical protein D3250_11310 [Nesterenkonia natronophila]